MGRLAVMSAWREGAWTTGAWAGTAWATDATTPQIIVPDVVGLSQAAAELSITGVGLVFSASTAYSDTIAAGIVISQSPAAGESIDSGDLVSVVVSLGAEPADADLSVRVTITSKLVNDKVSEGSAFKITARYFDDSTDVWEAITPTSAKYRIDIVNGYHCWTTVLDWTELTPATSNTISITGAQNAIQTCGHEERRQITVMANAGLATQYEVTYLYRIKNIAGIS
jgi:hypothetical protein